MDRHRPLFWIFNIELQFGRCPGGTCATARTTAIATITGVADDPLFANLIWLHIADLALILNHIAAVYFIQNRNLLVSGELRFFRIHLDRKSVV